MTIAPYRKAALCRETTSTTGTGTINLDLGAKPRHQTIVAGVLTAYGDTTPGDQAKAPYTLLSGNGIGWESGIGTVTLGTPSTFSRDIVKESSSGGSLISLAGVSEIYIATEAMDVFFRNINVRASGFATIAIDDFADGDTNSYPGVQTRGANGTEAAPTYPTAGKLLGGITSWGWNELSSTWILASQILTLAAADWTDISQPTRMRIAVNQSGLPSDQWNAAYNTNYTISGGGTVATTGNGAFPKTIIGSNSHSSGKFYFELYANAVGGEYYWGLAEATHVNTRNVGSLSPASGGTTKSVGFGSYSTVFHSWFLGGSATASGMPSGPNNEWLGFVVDLDTGYFLVRKCSAPTVWYGNNSNLGDPASIATHGFPFTPFATDLFLAYTDNNQGAGGSAETMNAGASSFQAAAPVGYDPWASGNSDLVSLELWDDGGVSSSGLVSKGPGALNFLEYYANGLLIADGSGITITFGDLSDANFGTLGNNDFAAYNTGTSKWTNRTPTAVTALLNAVVGDSGSGGTKGLVPAPGAGDAAAGKFLKADGTFAVPSGGVATLDDVGDVTITAVASNDFIAWSGSAWTNRTVAATTALLNAFVGDSGSGGTKGLVPAPGAGDAAAYKYLKADGTFAVATVVLTSAHILVGNGSNIGVDVAVSGDVTLANTGAYTIVTHAVTNAKMAQMAAHTFKGNNTGSTADALDLTATQLTAELNAMVGDSGSGGTKGLVPAPAAGDAAAAKFLKADGTYAVPAGTGISSISGASDAAISAPADNDILVYISSSSKWTNKRNHYDIGFSAPQTTAYTASQVIGHHAFSTAVTIPANFGAYLGRTSRAGGSAVTTASTVFSVEQAAAATPNTFSQIGTITFALGTVTPTFATSGGVAINFAANDRLRIVAPASPDATFVGFYATVVGSET